MSLRKILEQNEAFIFTCTNFREIKASLSEIFGVLANSVLSHAGIRAGERSYQMSTEAAKDRREALGFLSELKADENWGDLAFEKMDWERYTGRILVTNSFEARGVRSEEPSCYFFKGYLIGFLSEMFQEQILVNEDKCAARGDNQCEFAFRKA